MSSRSASTVAPTTTSSSTTPNEGWIVALVTACVFMSVVNTTMVNVSLPDIGDSFGASPASLGWLVTLYSLTFGVATPFYGRLGDRYGLRRMFVIGLCIFVVASLLAGLAPTFALLMLFRAGQAFGAAAIPSLGIGMLARAVPQERRGRSLGIVSTAVGAGSALGPTLGGGITQLVSWRMVFLISALLAVLIPLCLRYLPATRGERGTPPDWLGGITLGATIAGILLVTAGLQRTGATSTLVIISVLVALIGLTITIWRQRIAENPFIERTLLDNRRYLLLCVTGFCAMAGNIGALVVAPFLFDEINGLSAGQIGLALLPTALAVALLSRTTGRLADRYDPFLLIIGGLFVNLVTLILLATFGIGWPVVPFVALSTFLGIGQAFVNSPLSVVLTRTDPQRIYGVGLGLYNMLFFVGSGFGAALSTALFEAREGAGSTILPFYFGDDRYTHISDAFLPAIVFIFVGLLTASAARMARTET
ncbi:MAG TPA: MFS transporter [Thermomicrobiales bacterium]|nr:MFS transporter [Thermomicrobiales bacterium]